MNIFWKIFFLAISAVLLMIGGAFFYSLYNYMKFDVAIPAKVHSWRVIETAPSEFQIVAEYSYFLKIEQKGKWLFSSPKYANSFIAQKHLNDLEKHSWTAYVDSAHPKISALQHNFPFKALIHFLLAISVTLYFLWLRNYIVSRFALDVSENVSNN